MTAVPEQKRLPARDWLILPLLSLVTLLLIFGLAELGARLLWPEQPKDACSIADPALGLRYKPNCQAMMKAPESPWVQNAYNECGLRTAESCAPKPSGGFRVAVLGTSIASGFLVPYPQTYAARASALLSSRCGVPVDFQNLAVPGVSLATVPLHVDQALSLQPDLMLLPFSVYDLEVLDQGGVQTAPPPPPGGIKGLMMQAMTAVRASRAAHMTQHFLYQNLDRYLPLYLSHGDQAGFLRKPTPPAWQARLQHLERLIADIQARLPANVRLMVVFVPSRPMAALAQWQQRPADVHPDELGRLVGEAAARTGAGYLDLTPAFAAQPDAATLFYPVDGHPNGQAQAVIARGVADALVAGGNLPGQCRGHSALNQ